MSNYETFAHAAYLDAADVFAEDLEHDDTMDADAYDARRRERDGWATDTWDGRW